MAQKLAKEQVGQVLINRFFKFLLLNSCFTHCIHKGQLISKCLFGTFNSSKKPTKKFDLPTILTSVLKISITTAFGKLIFGTDVMVPQVELFSFVFLEELKTPKNISIFTDL